MFPAEDQSQRTPAFADYLGAVKHGWVRIVAPAVAVGLLAALFSSLMASEEASYQNSAEMLVGGTEASPIIAARIVSSRPIAEAVAEELGGSATARSLVSNLAVTPIPESNILSVSYTADDPQTAAQVPNLFVEEYLAFSAQQERDLLESRYESLQKQLRSIERRLDAASRGLQRNLLIRELETSRSEASSLRRQLAQEIAAGRVIGAAAPSDEPIGQPMSPLVVGTGAGIATLFLLLAVVLLREHFSDRLRTRSDIAALTGTPVLAVLPEAGASDGELRLLATDLHSEMQRAGIRALLLASLPAGLETHDLVAGVADRLREADRKATVVETGIEASGSTDGNNSSKANRRFTPPAAEKLVAELRTAWDTILITGPGAISADAASLGASVDAVLLVVGSYGVSQTHLSRAREHLARTGTPLIGTVVLSSDKGTPLRDV